jgi:hypothetical protein
MGNIFDKTNNYPKQINNIESKNIINEIILEQSKQINLANATILEKINQINLEYTKIHS